MVGMAGVTISGICTDAHVSRTTYYRLFSTRTACFLGAFDRGSDQIYQTGALAYAETQGPWEHRLRAALDAMLGLLAANPAFARLCIAEVHHAGPEAVAHLSAVIDRCRKAFGGTEPATPPPGLPRDAFENVLISSVLRLLTDYVAAGKARRLTELMPALTYAIALPVVGRERAVASSIRGKWSAVIGPPPPMPSGRRH